MRITWAELAIDLTGQDSDTLLDEWRWLVPQDFVLRMVSSLGDAFLEDKTGAIHWLDVGAASLTRIAENKEDFDARRQRAENAENWFVPQLVGDLLSSGKALAVGQCYSYKIPLTLNGKFEPDNFEPCGVEVHFHALGKIQAQVRDLPVGTRINSVKLEE